MNRIWQRGIFGLFTSIILSDCLLAETEERVKFAFTGHTYPLVFMDLQYILADSIKRHSVNFTIVAGDVVRGPSLRRRRYSIWNKATEEEQWDRYKMLRDRIGGTVYWSAGNHDINAHTDFSTIRRATGQDSLYFSFDKIGIRFIILSTIDATKKLPLIQIDDSQLAWFKDELKTADASSPLFIFSHHRIWALSELRGHVGNRNQWNYIRPLLDKFKEVYWFFGDAVGIDPSEHQDDNIRLINANNNRIKANYFIVDAKNSNSKFTVSITPYSLALKSTSRVRMPPVKQHCVEEDQSALLYPGPRASSADIDLSQDMEQVEAPLLPEECQRFSALAEEAPPRPSVDLTEDVIRVVKTRRTCLKSYPWPEGEFFPGTNADRMREIRDSVNDQLDNIDWNRVTDADGILDALADKHLSLQEARLYYRLFEGGNIELIRLYGELLYLISLRNEGRSEEVARRFHELRSVYGFKLGTHNYDRLEELTYYSRSTVYGMFVVLNYFAESRLKRGHRLHPVLERYYRQRSYLEPHFRVLGDPLPYLLAAAGCEKASG